RAVIDYDDAAGRAAALGEHAVDGGAEIAGAVMDRDHDVDGIGRGHPTPTCRLPSAQRASSPLIILGTSVTSAPSSSAWQDRRRHSVASLASGASPACPSWNSVLGASASSAAAGLIE